jgi:hypothetical protein
MIAYHKHRHAAGQKREIRQRKKGWRDGKAGAHLYDVAEFVPADGENLKFEG